MRRARVESGLTQLQLAEAADVADATISRLERGRLSPSGRLVVKLAAALGVTTDTLLAHAKKGEDRGQQRSLRPAEARLVAVVRDFDDGQVDDVTRAVKLLVGVGRRHVRSRK